MDGGREARRQVACERARHLEQGFGQGEFSINLSGLPVMVNHRGCLVWQNIPVRSHTHTDRQTIVHWLWCSKRDALVLIWYSKRQRASQQHSHDQFYSLEEQWAYSSSSAVNPFSSRTIMTLFRSRSRRWRANVLIESWKNKAKPVHIEVLMFCLDSWLYNQIMSSHDQKQAVKWPIVTSSSSWE